MKSSFLFPAAVCLMLASCAHKAPPPPPPGAAQAAAIERERREYERQGREFERERRERVVAPPRKGMTRDEIRAEYGRPATINSTVRFECWTYSFNGVDARTASPFHDTSANIRCSVYFDQRTGKVDNFTWTASNPVLMGGSGTNGNIGNGVGTYRRY